MSRKMIGVGFVTVEVGQHVAQFDAPGERLFLQQETVRVGDDGFEILAVDELQHEVRTIILRKIIVNARDGGVVERGQQVGFALEVLDDGLPHQRVGSEVDHLFDRHQFYHIGEVQVAGAVDRSHAANADHFLNQIALGKRGSRLQLPSGGVAVFVQWLGNSVGIQGDSPNLQIILCKDGIGNIVPPFPIKFASRLDGAGGLSTKS